MPWRIAHNHPACRPGEWAVINEVADREGRHSIEGCHPSRERALAQQRALYANEPAARRQASHHEVTSMERKRLHVPQVQWKAVGSDPGELEGYASVFGNVDLDGDVVEKGAFKTTLHNWSRSHRPLPLVADHNLSTEGVIGSVTKAWEDDHGVRFRARFSSTPKAQEIRTKLAEGHIDGFSFTYLPLPGKTRHGTRDGKAVRFIDELQVFEFTVTPFPVNQLTGATAVKAVSDRPWSGFTQADYTDEQWARACLIDTGQGEGKQRYSLPVREPSGTLNRNGVHAAAARLNQVQAPAEKKAAAARALVRLYGELDEEPPDSLRRMAGQRAASIDWDSFSAAARKALEIPHEAAAKAAFDVLLDTYTEAAGSADEPPTAAAAPTTGTEPADGTAEPDRPTGDASAYALAFIHPGSRDGAPDGRPRPDPEGAPADHHQVLADMQTAGDLDQLEAEINAALGRTP